MYGFAVCGLMFLDGSSKYISVPRLESIILGFKPVDLDFGAPEPAILS